MRRLNAQAATFRQDAFGTAAAGTPCQVEYDRGERTVPGYYSPVKSKVQTEDAGFIDDYDSVVRVRKSTAGTFAPELHKAILIREMVGTEVKEIPLTVESILGTHPVSAEWILACNAAN